MSYGMLDGEEMAEDYIGPYEFPLLPYFCFEVNS